MCVEGLIPDLKDELSLQNEPSLIFPLVDMQADAGRRIIRGFDESVRSAGLLSNRHKRYPTTAHLDSLTVEVWYESRH
jgi:hypothetical protein